MTGDRIERMFAYTVIDENGDEGVVSYPVAGVGYIPLVGADLDRAVSLQAVAQQIADTFHRPVQLAVFSVREDGITLTPRTPR